MGCGFGQPARLSNSSSLKTCSRAVLGTKVTIERAIWRIRMAGDVGPPILMTLLHNPGLPSSDGRSGEQSPTASAPDEDGIHAGGQRSADRDE